MRCKQHIQIHIRINTKILLKQDEQLLCITISVKEYTLVILYEYRYWQGSEIAGVGHWINVLY